jgi:hypothetical protein
MICDKQPFLFSYLHWCLSLIHQVMKLTVNKILLGVLETMMPGVRIWLLEFITGGGRILTCVHSFVRAGLPYPSYSSCFAGMFLNWIFVLCIGCLHQSNGDSQNSPSDTIEGWGTQNYAWCCKRTWGPGLYRRAGITMARDVPSSSFFFACYTLLQQLYPNQNFMAGCLPAIPATVLVTPMDIIKTHLQVWTHFGTTLSFSIFCVVYIMYYRLYSCVVVRSIKGVQVDWWELLLEHIWSRQMKVFLLCTEVPIFMVLSVIVLEDLNHPMYPFLGRYNILDCSLVNPLLFVFQWICLLWMILIWYHLWTLDNLNRFFFTLQEFVLLDDGICRCIVRSKLMMYWTPFLELSSMLV